MGSDVLGRNMLAGLAFGARISLLVGVTSTLGAIGLGVLLGAVAGYYGGVVDDLLMRVTEFFQIIPTFVLLMVLVAFLEPSLASAVIGIALISWPQVARVVRGEFLSLTTVGLGAVIGASSSSARTARRYASRRSPRDATPHGLVCFTMTHVGCAKSQAAEYAASPSR